MWKLKHLKNEREKEAEKVRKPDYDVLYVDIVVLGL